MADFPIDDPRERDDEEHQHADSLCIHPAPVFIHDGSEVCALLCTAHSSMDKVDLCVGNGAIAARHDQDSTRRSAGPWPRGIRPSGMQRRAETESPS